MFLFMQGRGQSADAAVRSGNGHNRARQDMEHRSRREPIRCKFPARFSLDAADLQKLSKFNDLAPHLRSLQLPCSARQRRRKPLKIR
jgi:hypothetical protein